MKRLTRRIVAPLRAGSNPVTHPNLYLGCSQVGKAQDFDSCMRRFEPCHPSQYGPLAQSVEHLTFNQGVPRSSRGWITRKSAPVRKNGSFFVDTVVITYCVIDINLVK